MKRLWIELQRWNNSRAVSCRKCGPAFGPRRRLRTPLAYHAAQNHRDRTGHRVRVARCG